MPVAATNRTSNKTNQYFTPNEIKIIPFLLPAVNIHNSVLNHDELYVIFPVPGQKFFGRKVFCQPLSQKQTVPLFIDAGSLRLF
ncbi:hypothetical protein D1164_20720 [Mariniphaga sediminis]|uniref:Uncharacterized protein n=1 Tax=Mariniphaga sediminis TaxID=1628158 RepID=A0A399CWC6_9BACT|nr:hypothetical protein D1164_20720 [Mariniphaga sediminis]